MSNGYARWFLALHSNGQFETINADWASHREGSPMFVFGVGGFTTGGPPYPFYWLPIEQLKGVREITGLDQESIDQVKQFMRPSASKAPVLKTFGVALQQSLNKAADQAFGDDNSEEAGDHGEEGEG